MSLTFIDLCAGLGGFHKALADLGHKCVYACEIDDTLRELYLKNFPNMKGKVYGDIRKRQNIKAIPAHDVLCAGFPCQPFSKSGSQKGMADTTHGTLFHEIVKVLKKHKTEFVILENVGNFERHDGGRTWKVVKQTLEKLGYHIRGTEHLSSGGNGLLSPHHLGFPHTRERFYMVARRGKQFPVDPFPEADRARETSLTTIVQRVRELKRIDYEETRLTEQQYECIEHWNLLLRRMPEKIELPSFPIWSDELDATYRFDEHTPYMMTTRALRLAVRTHPQYTWDMTHEELIKLLPAYAGSKDPFFPEWKVQFIRQNRKWLQENQRYFSKRWVEKLRRFPPSLRKFEWNCNGEERDLWQHVLQFRPSGLRIKRYSTSPALIAMTSTQIPILGPKRRFLTRIEGLRLQGFSDGHILPESRNIAFKALGNAVHVEVVKEIARRLLSSNPVVPIPPVESQPCQDFRQLNEDNLAQAA